jgi:YggT family protein
MGIICVLLNVLLLILIAQIVVSWIMVAGWRPQGPARQGVDLLDRITRPIYRPVRGLLPSVRAGGMGIDFSPIIVFIVIILLQQLIC